MQQNPVYVIHPLYGVLADKGNGYGRAVSMTFVIKRAALRGQIAEAK